MDLNGNSHQNNSHFKTQKLNEYKQREAEMLSQINKPKIQRKPYKDMVVRVSGIFESLDKYFNLPKKMKEPAKKVVLKVKDI